MTEYIDLLKELIRTPSFSKKEDKTADALEAFLLEKGLKPNRLGNNVWVKSRHWQEKKKTVLLNSHHDTVRPVEGWTKNPFVPLVESNKLYGLGSNDAGGCLVALLAAFIYQDKKDKLPYNLIWAGTAEEEISGKNGITSILPKLGKIDLGIVGEPTLLQAAISEKGLMVLDGLATGISGHAARNEGENALYKALSDIETLRHFSFPKSSKTLGKIKVSVTQIRAGKQHNIVPDECKFVVDVRTTDAYSNKETFDLLQQVVDSKLEARSFRLNPSGISEAHPLVQRAVALGATTYGSPTLSDQAFMPFPSLKIGCGDSARSHTADEYIKLEEIENGIRFYRKLLEGDFFINTK